MYSCFANIIQLLFPATFSEKDLKKIPKAPEPIHDHIFSLFDYHSDSGKKLIYYIKKHRDFFLMRTLAEKMHEHLQEYLAEQQQFSHYHHPLIIPVPMTTKQKHQRGFNQNHILAKQLAKHLRGRCRTNLVYKTKETRKQALIQNKSQRFKNVHDAFTIPEISRKQIVQQDIIIVDDLVTTGATLLEITKVLKDSGARNIIAITIAH